MQKSSVVSEKNPIIDKWDVIKPSLSSATEADYRKILDSLSMVGVVIYEVRENGNKFYFKLFNKAAQRIDSIKAKDVLGKPLLSVFPGANDKKFGLYSALQKVYKTGESILIDPVEYKDEERGGWRQNSIHKLSENELIVVYQDVSKWVGAQKDLEKKIKQQEQLNNVMVERELKMIELKKENEELKKKINYLRK